MTMDVTGRKTEIIKRDILQTLDEGYDVVLCLGEDARPERVLKLLSATAGEWKVDLVLRHADLREYLEHALVGASAGAFFGGSAAVLAAIAAGTPISLAAFLTAAGVGAAVGGLLGLATTPCSVVKVYKRKGNTYIKFEQ